MCGAESDTRAGRIRPRGAVGSVEAGRRKALARLIGPAGQSEGLYAQGGPWQRARAVSGGVCPIGDASSRSSAHLYGARWRSGSKLPQISLVVFDDAAGGFGYLIPDAGDVTKRFGDDQPRVIREFSKLGSLRL